MSKNIMKRGFKVMKRKMYRSNTDKVFKGVCGGLAKFFGFDSSRVRVIFVIFFGISIWIYFILLFIMPMDDMIY